MFDGANTKHVREKELGSVPQSSSFPRARLVPASSGARRALQMKNLGKSWSNRPCWEQCGARCPRILFRYNDHEVVKVDDMLLGFVVVILGKRIPASNLDESGVNRWQEHIRIKQIWGNDVCLKCLKYLELQTALSTNLVAICFPWIFGILCGITTVAVHFDGPASSGEWWGT